MAEKIALVSRPWLAREDSFPIDAELLFQLIPLKYKLEASPLLKKLEAIVAVNGKNQVRYGDGTIGSRAV